jgi:hypothetical protein
MLTGAMHFKGSVSTLADLANIQNPSVGDMYNVTANGANYAWDGTNWVKMSETVDLSQHALTSYVDAQDLAEATARANADAGKVDKVTTASRVYGTDENGNPITYGVNLFGNIDDVTIDGTSIVSNRVAPLGSMAGEDKDDYSTKAVADTLYSAKSLETTVSNHTSNTSNPHSVTKAQVGLGNCDNTSDLNKPISTATQTALDGKVSKSGDTMSGNLEVTSGLICLEGIGSAVANSTSRLVLGTPTNQYAYLTGNSNGAFGIYSDLSGTRTGIACYPTQNFFADATTKTIDLGRPNNVWKTGYINKLSDGTNSDTVANIISGASAGSTAVQPASISDMATKTWVGQQGYTTNIGTVTSVNNVLPVNGNVTITIPDSATLGNITGTLSNQNDLQVALNAKQNLLTAGTDLEIVEGDAPLPSGYTRLQFIQSSGTQFINTGYTMTSDVVEYGIVMYGRAGNGTSLFGSEYSGSNTKYSGVPYGQGSNGPSLFIGSSAGIISTTFEAALWNKYIVKTTSSTNGTVSINGEITSFTYLNGIQKNLPLYLFANNKDNTAIQISSIKVKSFYIKDNNVLVRNLVAARRESDSAVGMFDTLNNVFYPNAGTGTFIAGEVAPETTGITIRFTNDSGYITNSAIENMQTTSNLVTSISSESTDAQYPSAKCMFDEKTDWYGTCATAKATQTKVVVCEGFVLKTGVSIRVKFSEAQSYNGTPKLNVNGTGAIAITSSGTTGAVKYYWRAGEILSFTYDGSYWIVEDGGVADTTYYGVTRLSSSATSTSTALATTPSTINAVVQNMIEPYAVYSASATYSVGDRVRYSYQAWECTTAITTAEEWNSAHWAALDPIQTQIDGKQNTLVSGTNIKTINNTSLLGSGNISIAMPTVDSALSATSENPVQNKVIYSALSNKVNTSDYVAYTASELETLWSSV